MSVYKKYVNVQGGQTPFISGSKGGGCFPAGSLVSTTRGEIPIEDIKINDKVYCFDENDKRWVSFVEKTWEHIPSETVGYILTITHEKGVLRVTDNHYLYDESNEYKEAKDWKVGEYLTLEDNDFSKILSIESENYLEETVYNLTVNTYHNYICQGIRLSNKGGGGKGGGGAAPAAREDPNTLFSTDILFLTVSLGEGPVYRINPNGPQDIEINEGVADDLINIDGDGTENNEVFKTLTTTGTLTQGPMSVFGSETVTPQNLNNAVGLKNGNVAGIPKSSVILQSTSAKDWDALRFNFVIQGLQKSDSSGNVSGTSVSTKITVFDNTGTTEIAVDEHTVSGKTNTRFKFQRDIVIPEENKSVAGYKFTVEKTSGDSDSNRVADNIQFVGWDEIEYDDMAYPRTALIGYAIKSFNEHEGRVPTFTSLVKGLLVKVPTNYNQPTLADGEIDWRQLEVPETGSISIDGESTNIGYTQQGYYLQSNIDGNASRKVESLTITNAGSGYTSVPSVSISGGGGSTATATATLTTGKVTALTVTSQGTGYTSTPTITIAAPSPETFNGATAIESDGKNKITVSSSFYSTVVTGDRVTYANGGGTNVGGLTSGTIYFVIKDGTTNRIKLATSYANADAGTAIALSDGVGSSHTLTKLVPDQTFNSVTDIEADGKNQITVSSTFYSEVVTGDRIVYANGGGTNIGGLSSSTSYFVIKTGTTNRIKLAASRTDADAGTAISISDGVGASHTLTDGVPATETFNAATAIEADGKNEISVASSFYDVIVTGNKVTYANGGGTTVGGLTTATDYFVIKTGTTNRIKLASSLSNANAGTAINISDGVGASHTLTDVIPTETFDAAADVEQDAADDKISVASAFYDVIVTGSKVTYANGGGTNVGGLTSGTDYFIIKDGTTNRVKLATSFANATGGTAISISDGVGASHTLTSVIPTETFNGATEVEADGKDQITVSSDFYSAIVTGDEVTYANGGGTNVTGLTSGTNYFVIKTGTTNRVKLATSRVNAIADTEISIDDGVGASHTFSSTITTQTFNSVTDVEADGKNEISVGTSFYNAVITGDRATYANGGGTNVTGLTSGTIYFIIKTGTTNRIKLATSHANAVAGTTISIDDGVGTSHTLTSVIPATETFDSVTAIEADGKNQITVSSAFYTVAETGDLVTYANGGGTNVTGLTSGTNYFIIKTGTTNRLKLAVSAQAAADGTAIALDDGVGASHTLTGVTATSTAVLTLEQFGANPVIYEGVWDGTFTYSWTQNPVWVIYDILTNGTYGLGIAEENIDKFMFYKVAQYCDCCDATTGRFTGVDGFGDGTFRHKPRTLFSTVKETLVGLPRGVQIKERRFITDLSIQEDVQVMDTINKITSTFRGLLYYSGGKVTLNVDMPDDVPVAVFNDANIKKDTLKFSGTKESDIITGVDVSYIEPSNHFKREVVRIDDQEALRDRNQIENIKQIDLAGVTRRSQASRYGQYMIAASKFLRRQVEFVAGADALNLTVGDIITVATKSHGLAYGFGGKVATNSSTSGDANILLEHFTSPAITASTFTANSQPLAVRVIKMDSDRVDYYLVSNSAFQTLSTSNADSGVDLVEVKTIARWNYNTKGFVGGGDFVANNVPQKGDLWTFGEVNPDNFYDNQNDRLFKITTIGRNEDEEITLTGIEYISNVYVDSDSLIAYVPVRYDDTVSSLTQPPTPELNLEARPRRLDDGSVTHDLLVDVSTDQTGYPLFLQTEVEMGRPDAIFTSYLTSNASISPKSMTASNTGPLANGEPSILSGKNGFKTNTGEIRLICDAVNNPDFTDTSNGNVVFKVASLHQVRDTNFMKHVLEVNDGITFDSGLKGFDKVAFDLNQRAASVGGFGFVDHGTRLVNFTANVIGTDLSASNGSIIIENEHSGESTLFNALPTPPFFVTINQLVDTRFFDNREMYIAGTSFTEIQSNVITGNLTSGTNFVQPLVRGAPFKEAVRVFVDGLQIPTSAWNFTSSSNDSVTITGLSDEVTSRVEADYYTVPTVEQGDNLQFFSGNVYSVVDTTYSTDSASHNVALTANNIYRVKLGSKLLANTRGTTAINISADPVGETNNVFGRTFTFDYDTNLYPGSFSLANNAVYSIQTPTDFESIGLPADRLLKNQDPGIYVFKARNVNSAARKSAPATESILINQVPIQKVENLEITESLYLEQTVGAAVRAVITFDHITNQEVTDYEISYKLGGAAADLTNFQTVKASAQGVDPDGKIRFAINNVDRGIASGVNNIVVRVTPLNGTIRGVTLEKSQAIVGKTAPPQNVTNFSIAQVGEEVQFSWAYVTNADGSLFDPDLRDIVIKRASGTVAEADFATTFVTGTEYIVVSAGSTKKSAPIDTFGTFTYLAKTRDTSGNLSDTVVGVTFTSTKLSSLFLLQAYSEDAPSGNVVAGIPNTNRGEFNFPSFANSNTGGLSFAKADSPFDSSTTDNSNGTSTGYAAISGSPTDLLAGSGATYQTQVRDLGQVKTVSFTANIVGTATTATDWNSLHTNIAFGVVEPQETATNADILHDTALGGAQGIGTVLGFANSAAAAVTYDEINETLVSGGSSGNVFAIWNASETTDGQHVDDTSNANSYALIAGVKNATAVVLGEVFHANGVSTGGNTFANLTANAASYKLVDLNQFSDASVGSTTFLGDSNALDASLIEIRTSETDPFFANGNVNISTFSGNLGDRFQNFAVGDRRARFFQFRHTVTNSKPQEVNYTLDKFEYTVDSPSKEFRTRVTFLGSSDAGGNTAVDYTSTDFFEAPTFSATIVSTDNVAAVPVCFVLGSTRTGANINVIFSSNSLPAVGTVVDLIALGV